MSKKKEASPTPDIRDDNENTLKNPYLPKMRTNYHPSDKAVESATGVNFSVNMPNPAIDPIVANNISNAEFDYTDTLFPDNYDAD